MRTEKKSILVISSRARSLVNFRGKLLLGYIESGYSVHVVAPDFEEHPESCDVLREWGVSMHCIPFRRTGINPFFDVLFFAKLWGLVRRVKPEIVLAYNIKPVIYGLMAAAASGRSRRAAMITGLGYAFIGDASYKRKLVRYLVSKLYSISLRFSDVIFFQNPDDKNMFLSLGIIRDEEKIKIINGSGVDLVHFGKVAQKTDPVRFLIICRLLGDKGVREYVDAARKVKDKHPSACFSIVGGLDDNPNSITPKELHEWTSDGVIEYHGVTEDVRPYIADSSVFVLPSYREGTPRTVLEAMSMCRPIITTDAPGCKETVIDGKTGFLIPPRDSQSLADKMEYFVLNPTAIIEMGLSSRKYAEEKYDVEKVNNEIVEAIVAVH